MRYKLYIFLQIFLLITIIESKGQAISSSRQGKDFALFFAIKDYENWNDLTGPIQDARAIALELKRYYGFDTVIVENPTLEQIYVKLGEYLTKTYDSDAQLLIFFSGHGAFLESSKEGFLIPKNGSKVESDPWFSSALPHARLSSMIENIACPHILLMIDACYSGTFSKEIASKGDERPGANTKEALPYKIKALLEPKTRLFLTSGGKVRTPDPSDFAAHFLQGLESNRRANNPFLTISQLYANHIEHATPKPKFGTFADNQYESTFLFILNTNNDKLIPIKSLSPLKSDEEAWAITKQSNNYDVIDEYLALYPAGKYRFEAKELQNTIDDNAWKEAEAQNTLESYRKYQNENKNRNHLKEADIRRKKLEMIDTMIFNQMVQIKGGVYNMGCDKEQKDCFNDELPGHKVTLKDYEISRFEVTQKQWKMVMGVNPSYFQGCDDCPVEQVSWDDTQEFIKKLNKQTGRNYRLPTEAEWEYAARESGSKVAFGNGKQKANPKEINFMFSNDTAKVKGLPQRTTKVGSYRPNKLGLYDMSGNVWEWCSDWKGTYSATPELNPVGPEKGISKVTRGGAWVSDSKNIRTTYRGSTPPSTRLVFIGLRLAQSD